MACMRSGVRAPFGPLIMTDITLICADCGNEFVFTEGEQEFYQQKGIETPRYCLICRGKYGAQSKDWGRYGKDAAKIR